MASQVAERTKARDLGKFENFDQPKKQMKQTNLLNSNPTNPTTTKQPENPHHLVFQPTATIYQQNQQHSTSYNIYPTDQTTITTQTNFTTFSRKHKLVATPHKIK